MKPIYLDYAATTPVDEKVFSVAERYFKDVFYNPSSTHIAGQEAHKAVETARESCACAIGATADEIHFTSGGTEAVNLAMKCVRLGERRHIVVSAIEHDSVLSCAEYLSDNGYEVDYVKPTADGVITPDALKGVIRADTALVAVMTVNNIVGTIQPIKELAEVAHSAGAMFFTDAVQAVNSVDISVKNTNVDMLCVSAHKFYGLKGAGFLYARRGLKPSPFISGGDRVRGVRSGTYNVPAIVGMGAAIAAASEMKNKFYNPHTEKIARAFIDNLNCGRVIAKNAQRVNDILSVSFDGVNGGRLAVALSMRGVCCSVGSACSAGSATPPRTLVAMGERGAENSVRFSFGRQTTVECAIYAAETVNDVVGKLTRRTDK